MTPINSRNDPADFGFSNSELCRKFSLSNSTGGGLVDLCPKSLQFFFRKVDGRRSFEDSIGSIIHKHIVNFVSGFAVLITSPNRAQFLTNNGGCQP